MKLVRKNCNVVPGLSLYCFLTVLVRIKSILRFVTRSLLRDRFLLIDFHYHLLRHRSAAPLARAKLRAMLEQGFAHALAPPNLFGAADQKPAFQLRERY
jgi:hypothetical protein